MSTIKHTVPTQKRIVHLSTVTSYIKWSQTSVQGQRKKKKSLYGLLVVERMEIGNLKGND